MATWGDWTADSAVWELEHGTPGTNRFESAADWIVNAQHEPVRLYKLVTDLVTTVENLRSRY